MATLSDHIENVLNEGRMLLLGGQVLLGFTYEICFEPVFERMPWRVQIAEVVALSVMTAWLGWVIWPAPFHQIAEHGRETLELHAFATTVLDWALLPFAFALGLSLYPVAAALQLAHPPGIAIAGGLLALFAWYGGILVPRGPKAIEASQRKHRERKDSGPPDQDLSGRIKKVLIECRMALPGAQAFLGFQFAIVFTNGFEKLPKPTQWVHFGSLLAMTVAIVLLIAPAAFHRIVEHGEDTERFHAVASGMLLAALVFLAPGMAGDLYVVLAKVTGAGRLASGVAGSLLLAFYALWFAVSWWKRK